MEKSSLINENEKQIELTDVKPGDLLLYELVEPPEFIEIREDHLKEDIRANFMVIVDKLICFSEKSMVTHSALITNELQVVEATLPALRVRDLQKEANYYIHVFRVQEGVDASKVLNYLPQPVDNVNADPDSYALVMATLAAVACFLRVPAEDVKPSLVKLLKCVLFKVCEYLDNKVLPIANGDSNWFCSELTSYAYNLTALEENNSAYKLKIETKEKVADSIFNILLGTYNFEEKDEEIKKPEEYEDMFNIARDFFTDKQTASKDETLEEIKKHSKFFIAVFKKLLAAENLDSEEFKERLVKYIAAFVMPSDLVDCLPNKYWITNENETIASK